MMNIVTLILFTVALGLMGGIAAWLNDRSSPSAPGAAPVLATRSLYETLARYLLLGAVAALLVPLFLSFVDSRIVQTILEPATVLTANASEVQLAHNEGAKTPATQPSAPVSGSTAERWLVYTGLCLVASFSALRFIQSVTDRALTQGQKARELSGRIAALEAQTEEPPETPPTAAPQTLTSGPGPSQDRRRDLLNALRSHPLYYQRMADGLATELGLDRTIVEEDLLLLERDRLIERVKSHRDGITRWRIMR